MSCNPGFTWLLDGIIVVAIVFNISALARLNKAQASVEKLLVDLRFHRGELKRARDSLVAMANRHGMHTFEPAVDAYVDLHLGDENGRRS